jgi:hypothetical protein
VRNFKHEDISDIIKAIISLEESLEDKLDMLTSIGITTRNEDTFKTCEEIRTILCDEDEADSNSKKQKSGGLPSGLAGKKVGDVLLSDRSTSAHGADSEKSADLEELLS